MKRREFLRGAGAGMLGGTAIALGACGAAVQQPAPQQGQATTPEQAQAPAQTTGMLRWRMATSWPRSLDTIFGGAVTVAERVKELTEGKLEIQAATGGELVPALQVLDAVQAGTVEMGHTASYYYVGKNPAFGIATALPFGLTAQQQNAWLYYGGGMAALQPLYDEFNTVAFPAGNTGTQMGGWFRKEVNTPADLQGLKMRIPGLGGQVMQALGVVTQTIPGGEIYTSLERGTVDAAEWVGPYDDLTLEFYKVAKIYYYPGWWEPGPTLDVYINKEQWGKLPKLFQDAIKTAAYEANMDMLSKYEARNREALKTLVANGVQLTPYSKEIMDAARTAAFQLYDKFSSENPTFKAIYEPWKVFRDDIYSWTKTNELTFTNYTTSAG